MKSYTTGKVWVSGVSAQADGLQQSMLHQHIPLRYKDMLQAAGLHRDTTQLQISTYLVANAIREAFPDETAKVFDQTDFPLMPELDILPRRQTEHSTLGPIRFNEGCIEGQYDVLNAIFCDQFRLHSNPASDSDQQTLSSIVDWRKRLYLVYGDQKTVQLIRVVQSERQEATEPFDTYAWVLPIPALFHLLMNLGWGIQRIFEGTQSTADQSTLYHTKNILERKHIPSERAPIHHVTELIEHSFNARIVGLLLVHLRQRDGNLSDIGNVAVYLSKLTPDEFLKLVSAVQERCLSKTTTQSSEDEEFYNHVKFIELAETFLCLRIAIKYADIGLLRRVVDQCCIIFIGSGQENYASEMLRLRWLISTKACDPKLQQAILSNSFVNLAGHSDTWYPVDQMNEHLNLALKEILWARRNSTFNVDYLFDTCTWTASYCSDLRDAIEHELGETTSNRHTRRSRAEDIRSLAHNLAEKSLVFHADGRRSSFTAKDVLQSGLSKLPNAIDQFNSRFVQQEK